MSFLLYWLVFKIRIRTFLRQCVHLEVDSSTVQWVARTVVLLLITEKFLSRSFPVSVEANTSDELHSMGSGLTDIVTCFVNRY